MAKIIFSILILLTQVCGCRQDENKRSELFSRSADEVVLTDSLISVFDHAHQASNSEDMEAFLSFLDPVKAKSLRVLSRRHGYHSLKSYIETEFVNWPELDTLTFVDLQRSLGYVRLTFTGMGQIKRRNGQQLIYTFLMFKQYEKGWLLNGMASVEKAQYDRSGYLLSYHETDLPSPLRFPRMF